MKTFIDQFVEFCSENGKSDLEWESFYEFFDSRHIVKNAAKLKKAIKDRWAAIRERINILDKIVTLLEGCEIGVIEVTGLNAADSQKIFEIINSGGEKLTAVEILSAKPTWNQPISNVSGAMEEAAKKLYGKMGTIRQPSQIVKWDLPATLLMRVDFNMVLYPKELKFEKELTLGFQIISGIFERSITKNSIEKLSRNTCIHWDTDYENLIVDLSSMLQLIRSSDYFQFFKSWKTSILELTSVGCALNFILVSYANWKELEKPIGSNTKTKKFIKNCFILWDKLIYEYVNRLWTGNMDHTIASYLDRLYRGDSDSVFAPVSKERWGQLLQEIFESSKIGGSDIKLNLMKPLLYHFYCLSSIQGPDTELIEVDHILPKTKFEESQIPRKDLIKDNLFNLGLLPRRENACKGNKTLRAIESPWLKQQVVKYEQIPVDKFEYFSDLNNYRELFALRKDYFDKAFGEQRDYILNN